MSTPQVAVVIDWGGSWARTAVVDKKGNILWQSRNPNPRNGTKEEYLDNAERLLTTAIEQTGSSQLVGIGAAVAGPVEPRTGTFHQPPNLKVLDGVSFKSLWEGKFSLPVWVGNDANLAAMGEYYYGAGRQSTDNNCPVKTLFYVTLSTGVGGGAVDKGSLYLGANGLTGEIGHTLVDSTDYALNCECGSRGCLETKVSGTSIAYIAKMKVSSGEFPESTLTNIDSAVLDSEAVFSAAGDKDPLAVSIIDGVISALGIGLTNIVHLFNPDMIVLGGGVTVGLVKLDLLTQIKEQISTRTMSAPHNDFQLTSTALGDSVGLVGAAAMVWEQFK